MPSRQPKFLSHEVKHKKIKQIISGYKFKLRRLRLMLFFLWQVTFQYSFWDRFKTISTTNSQSCENMAKLIAHLLASSAISLSILKVKMLIVVCSLNGLILTLVVFCGWLTKKLENFLIENDRSCLLFHLSDQ